MYRRNSHSNFISKNPPGYNAAWRRPCSPAWTPCPPSCPGWWCRTSAPPYAQPPRTSAQKPDNITFSSTALP